MTTTLHVGSWVLAAPFRSPAVVVRETSALQLLSGGRFELGIGTGRPDAAREAALLGEAVGDAASASPASSTSSRPCANRCRRRHRSSWPVPGRASWPRRTGPRRWRWPCLPPPPWTTSPAGADLARAAGRDPELALQLSGVGGRLVAHLARQGHGRRRPARRSGRPRRRRRTRWRRRSCGCVLRPGSPTSRWPPSTPSSSRRSPAPSPTQTAAAPVVRPVLDPQNFLDPKLP